MDAGTVGFFGRLSLCVQFAERAVDSGGRAESGAGEAHLRPVLRSVVQMEFVVLPCIEVFPVLLFGDGAFVEVLAGLEELLGCSGAEVPVVGEWGAADAVADAELRVVLAADVVLDDVDVAVGEGLVELLGGEAAVAAVEDEAGDVVPAVDE